MPLAHVQSVISQNLLLASGFPRTPTSLPVNGSSSSRLPQHLLPPSALRRTQRSTAGDQPPAAVFRGTRWSATDRRAAHRPAPKSCRGCDETASGTAEIPHLTVLSPRGSEELLGNAPRVLKRDSNEPDARRRCSARLRRATGTFGSREDP